MRQAKVEPASVPVKANVAEELVLTASGPEEIVVSGGTVSTVQPYAAGAPVLPAASVPRTANM